MRWDFILTFWGTAGVNVAKGASKAPRKRQKSQQIICTQIKNKKKEKQNPKWKLNAWSVCQSVIKTFSPANECVCGKKLEEREAKSPCYIRKMPVIGIISFSFVMVAANRGGEAFKVYAQLP